MRTYKIEERGISLWPHQQEAVDLFMRLGRVYFHFEMGMGKTITALACALENDRIKKVLILAPLSAHPSWLQEIKRTNFDKTYIVLSYENFLKNFPDTLPADQLNSMLIVFDEAHKLKNWQAKTTKKAYKLFKNAPYKIMLSGTMADKAWDVFAQFKVLLPDILVQSWSAWIETFFVVDNYRKPLYFKHGFTIDDLLRPFSQHILVKNRSLNVKINKHTLRLEGEDHLPMLFTTDREEEELLRSDYSLTNFIREFRQAQLQVEKFETTLELLKQEPRAVVFVYFFETLEYYKKFLGGGAYYVWGGDKKDLEYALKSADRPLISTYCLKEGVNLQHYKSVIYHTLPLAYRDLNQSMSRVYRSGQTSDVDVFYLLNQTTKLDNIVAGILSKKKNVLQEIKKLSRR